MPPLSLLIKPASGSCNMRCKYCFYADETQNRETALMGRMSLDTMHTLVDKAMEYVLAQLEAAGQLENTVICISGDHYPYGMAPETWDELSGMEMDTNFEIFRSTLILWSGDMKEPVRIEKPCCSMDVLPTLLNLFGLPYDSRLLAGQDILSDSPGLVVLSNRSFITEEGRYNSSTDEWTPNEGVTVAEDYAGTIYQQVSGLFKHSANILLNDYYGSLETRTDGL